LVTRGDIATRIFRLGHSLAGRTAYVAAKRRLSDANSDAIINRACAVVDEALGDCSITLTTDETRSAGDYHYELEERDTVGGGTPQSVTAGDAPHRAGRKAVGAPRGA
jgi:hypothetical protein